MIGAAAYHFFLALLNKGADHTNKLLHLRQEWRGQFNSIDIHAVHATRAPLPSKPYQGKRVAASPVRPQLLSSAVFSCLLHRRLIRTHYLIFSHTQ